MGCRVACYIIVAIYRQDLAFCNIATEPNVASTVSKFRLTILFQISRSIGDAYLKDAEFNREPLLPKFRLAEPMTDPVLTAEPTIFIHKLNPKDLFLIFASDGLWEHLSNEEAVDIVQNNPRNVSLYLTLDVIDILAL